MSGYTVKYRSWLSTAIASRGVLGSEIMAGAPVEEFPPKLASSLNQE